MNWKSKIKFKISKWARVACEKLIVIGNHSYVKIDCHQNKMKILIERKWISKYRNFERKQFCGLPLAFGLHRVGPSMAQLPTKEKKV